MKREELEKCCREWRSSLLEELQQEAPMTDEEILERIDALILRESDSLSLKEKREVRKEMFNSIRRLDVIQELVDDNSITEIMVNGYEEVFIEREGRIRRWEKCFENPERLDDVIAQIAGMCNRVVNEQHPIADARLKNGDRVNIVLPPVAVDGPILTIRRFPDRPITMEDMTESGTITKEAADFLEKLVQARYSILIGGGTSTGKTTFLNALSAYIPGEERIVTIEDNAELQIQGVDNLVRLEARAGNQDGVHEITLRDLVKTALRMRPGRIIIGEVRGAEAGDWLTCLNTGHDGSLGSAHANSVRDMIGRLESMVLMGANLPIPVIRSQIASGIEILVHLKRDRTGKRRVEEIAEITGIENDQVQMHTLFRRKDGILARVDPLIRHQKWKEAFPEKQECR